MIRYSTAMLAVLALACVEKKEPVVDQAYINANLLTAEPTPKHAVNADLGGKIVYLGADVDKDRLTPGDRFKVTHYWKVIQAPGGEWRAFTHVNGAKEWMNVDETKMRKGYGPSKWKAGDIVKDEQEITLQKSWASPFASIYVGLYKGQGVGDRMPIVSGANDGKGRLLVARIPVSGIAEPPPPPKPALIPKTTAPPTIDGKADDAVWASAFATPEFAQAEGAPSPTSGPTTAKLLWDDTHLYVFVDVADKKVESPYKNQDDPLWKADVVELFIDADRNRRGYVELQVNPNNAHFDTAFSGGRGQGRDDTFASNMRSAVTRTDKGWAAEIAIPLEAVKGKEAASTVKIPPAVGDSWKLNIVRVDKNDGDRIMASGWAAIPYADFHGLDRLMTVTFADEKGQAAPAAPSPVAPDGTGSTTAPVPELPPDAKRPPTTPIEHKLGDKPRLDPEALKDLNRRVRQKTAQPPAPEPAPK